MNLKFTSLQIRIGITIDKRLIETLVTLKMNIFLQLQLGYEKAIAILGRT